MVVLKIALAGQLGAGCTEVARLISEKTGVKVFNSETLIRKLIVDLGTSFRNLQEYVASGEVNMDKILDSLVLDIINAEEDVVIEGRSAFFLLKRKDVFKVLLVADDDFRAERVSNRRGITLEEAKDDIKHSDEERRNLVKRFHNVDLLDPKLYDLVINTSFRDMEDIANLVLKAYEELFKI
ncbi:cytidylate kinase family protein [Candidatus Bathyarchaeota archaeon]|nr:cytidylate kinase family protein [Candidatus Bathyarchaeota archaeon]